MIRSLLLISLFLFSQLSWSESNSAFTGYEKIVDAAFPSAELNRSYQKPSIDESRALENMRNTLIQVIQTVSSNWTAAAAGGAAVSESEQRAVIEILKATPIYVCEKRCSCSDSPNGCAKGRPVGDAIGAILTVESCAFSEKGCQNDSTKKLGLEKRLTKFFESGFFQIAYWKLNGIQKFTVATNRKSREQARLIFDDAVLRMNKLRSSCPRRFPEWGYDFLKSAQSITETGTAQAKCAQKVLSAFVGGRFSAACKNVINADLFEREFAKNLFKNGFKVTRCDSNCAMMTCGSSPATDSRLIRFGEKKWIAMISESLCEGQFPQKPELLIQSALEWVSKASEAEQRKCAAEIYRGPVFNREKAEGKVEQGVEIELIPTEN